MNKNDMPENPFKDIQRLDSEDVLKKIVDIFHLDGVELVRVSGLCRLFLLPPGIVETILTKLSNAQLITYKYKTICPHCGEISYIIKDKNELLNGKICDTCKEKFMPKIDDNTLVVNTIKK